MTMSNHDHHTDECLRALEAVHAFLHGELDEAHADLIRLHLDACEHCMESYEVEETITALVRRSSNVHAPASLRAKVTRLHVQRRVH